MIPQIRDVRTIATAPAGINLLVVKVETTEPGLYGLGCATYAYRYATVQHLIETYLKPLLLGKPVNAISELWQLMHQNGYWRSGPIANNAISGIDMALWDIKGKMAGMPLYELFGGKVRAGVPVYRHANGADPDALTEAIQQLQEIGFRYVRCQCTSIGGYGHPGVPQGAARGALYGSYTDRGDYMRRSLALFEGLRTRLGEELGLIYDVHEALHPAETRVFCREMDRYHLYFLEDVVGHEHIDWLPQIRSQCATPLAQGELFIDGSDWRRPIMERSIDFVRCHLSQIGGITPGHRLAAFAEPFGVRVCWHGPADMSPIAHAANIHLDLAHTNVGVQEWSGIDMHETFLHQGTSGGQAALEEVFSGIPEYKDGYVYVQDTPGLGVDIDEQAAAKYPCTISVTDWTQARNYDGSLQTP